ncbi:hypothetical protein C8A00DRAFT_15033 [Chaetomidium leptoderma]|uniref:C3H1-type domain-containing protein n=1 Tax=Chaetomidium leptoderma TaxID=669021 RepID=A0AAN6VLG7_9PEZI|nr:hypothetical protein C8A00DRAFT_15033 [Chaetomidium leptoderma]
MATSHPSEHRHMRSGSLNIPPQSGHSGSAMGAMPGARFEGPRSPPNTSHVPCKFFRQGACQAGNACPFSHDLGIAAETVCKYFAKGNCKFGPKCANIHVLPDGRRINYGKNGVTIGAPPGVALGARVNPTTYHQPSNSALTNSFLRADQPAYTNPNAYGAQDDVYGHQLGMQPGMEQGLPVIDTTYSSNPASAYGSPLDEDASRLALGLSPVNVKGLSVLDAPLPASFDSNGISLAARYGPWPSSVPSKFGLESPTPSLHSARDARTSETLKLLHTSAFGSNDHLSPSAIGANDANGFGSSPPVGSANLGSVLGSDEYFGKRFMHSSSLRYAKPRLISSSVPKIDRDWEAEFMFEEDYVPGALANEVLTPAEKARRGSITNTVRMTDTMEPGAESLPIGATKFGSPAAMAASPSRWGPLFQRQKEEDFDAGGSTRSMKHVSAFGHVGSPLRNSSLASALTAELNGKPSSGSTGRTDSGMESVSALTQQLRETRLAEGDSGNSSPHLYPTTPRHKASGSSTTIAGIIGKERGGERSLERHISSGSISSSVTGRFTTPIDEEDSSFVFRMEEEDDAQARTRKRVSGGNLGVTSPLSTAWSYANVVATNRAATNTANGNKGATEGSTETVGGR